MTSLLTSQNVKQNYEILFTRECSFADALDILYNAYSSVVGDENVYDLNIEQYQFNFGKIVLLLNNEPNTEQIYYLNGNKNLVSFELINNKARNDQFKEFMENNKNKTKKQIRIPQVPNYILILKYKFKANPDYEERFLLELFGTTAFYEKDADKLVISVPNKNTETFVQILKGDDRIVYIQKL